LRVWKGFVDCRWLLLLSVGRASISVARSTGVVGRCVPRRVISLFTFIRAAVINGFVAGPFIAEPT